MSRLSRRVLTPLAILCGCLLLALAIRVLGAEEEQLVTALPVSSSRDLGNGRFLVRPLEQPAPAATLPIVAITRYPFGYAVVRTGGDGNPVRPPAVPAAVRVVRLASGPVPQHVLGFGTISAWQDALVSAEVAGVVRESSLALGRVVAADEPLVRLDERQRAIAVRQAEADLEVAKAQQEQAGRQVTSLEQRLATAKDTLQIRTRELTRWTDLAERSVVSSDRRDQAEKELRAAVLILQQLEGELSIARAQAESARASLERAGALRDAAALELERCVVRAPFAGELAERRVEPGAWIGAGTPVARLVDASRVRVRVHVREGEGRFLRPGAAASLSVPGLEEDAAPAPASVAVSDDAAHPIGLTGRVEGVAAAVDPRARKLAVDVVVENPERLLRPGMFARVRLDAGTLPQAVLVPDGAVVWEDGGQAVYVLVGEHVERRHVTLGLRQGEGRLLLSGLELPCEVVVEGTALLFDGAPVRRLED